jgi:hypothetical protein
VREGKEVAEEESHAFFLRGGTEKRGGKERRSRDERRKPWVRVDKWSSVQLKRLKIAKFFPGTELQRLPKAR